MKKWFLVLLSVPLILSSCVKDSIQGCTLTESTQSASTAEIDSLGRYMLANSLVATQHPSGVFYIVGRSGTGTTTPVACSNLTAYYNAFLLGSNTPFDSATVSRGAAQFVLGQLIHGWRRTLPVIKAGGFITLYVPPSMAYGASITRDGNGNVIIPANSYLKFDIDLLTVQ